jgi:hypothetical protein
VIRRIPDTFIAPVRAVLRHLHVIVPVLLDVDEEANIVPTCEPLESAPAFTPVALEKL